MPKSTKKQLTTTVKPVVSIGTANRLSTEKESTHPVICSGSQSKNLKSATDVIGQSPTSLSKSGTPSNESESITEKSLNIPSVDSIQSKLDKGEPIFFNFQSVPSVDEPKLDDAKELSFHEKKRKILESDDSTSVYSLSSDSESENFLEETGEEKLDWDSDFYRKAVSILQEDISCPTCKSNGTDIKGKVGNNGYALKCRNKKCWYNSHPYSASHQNKFFQENFELLLLVEKEFFERYNRSSSKEKKSRLISFPLKKETGTLEHPKKLSDKEVLIKQLGLSLQQDIPVAVQMELRNLSEKSLEFLAMAITKPKQPTGSAVKAVINNNAQQKQTFASAVMYCSKSKEIEKKNIEKKSKKDAPKTNGNPLMGPIQIDNTQWMEQRGKKSLLVLQKKSTTPKVKNFIFEGVFGRTENRLSNLYMEIPSTVPFSALRLAFRELDIDPKWVKEISYIREPNRTIAELIVFHEKLSEVCSKLTFCQKSQKATKFKILDDFDPLDLSRYSDSESLINVSKAIKRMQWQLSHIDTARHMIRKLITGRIAAAETLLVEIKKRAAVHAEMELVFTEDDGSIQC